MLSLFDGFLLYASDTLGEVSPLSLSELVLTKSLDALTLFAFVPLSVQNRAGGRLRAVRRLGDVRLTLRF